MKKKEQTGVIVNRRARFDYQLGDSLLCGIVLTGPEVRAARDGRVHLKGSFVTIRDNQLWLNNASFSVRNNQLGAEPITVTTHPRRLLATKKQIRELATQKQAGFSLIPTRMFTHQKHIKVEIAVGKGKKLYDKRQTIKQRDLEREDARLKR